MYHLATWHNELSNPPTFAKPIQITHKLQQMTFWDIAMSNKDQLLQSQDDIGKTQNHKRASYASPNSPPLFTKFIQIKQNQRMTFWDIAMWNNNQLLQRQDHIGKPQNHKRASYTTTKKRSWPHCLTTKREPKAKNHKNYLPALLRPGPKRRGISLITDSDAKKAWYFLASFFTSFLFLLSFFSPSTSIYSNPTFSACIYNNRNNISTIQHCGTSNNSNDHFIYTS